MASVAKRSRPRVVHVFTGRYGVLLVALLAMLMMTPLVVVSWFWSLVLAIIAAAVLVAGLVTARPGRRSLMIGLGLAAADIIFGRLAPTEGIRWIVALRAVLWIGTMAYVAVVILESIFEDERVTMDTLQASFCVYLLLALIWAYIPVLIEVAAPGSYRSPSGILDRWASDGWNRTAFVQFLTFSLANLTGAGDPEVSPASGFAKICASLEGMMGQIYLATVIARLVGMYTAREAGSRSDG
jgi:hypothetical protein